MDLKKIETTTTLRALPHVAHKLTEFAPGGWKAPTLEQTELFQVRTVVFRPVTLPGEFKPRPRKQCTGFPSVFVYTVRDRSHLSPSHHHHSAAAIAHTEAKAKTRGRRKEITTISDDQLAQGTSNFEWSFGGCQLSDGKVVCWSQRFGGEDLLCDAWFTSPERRGRSCWTCGNKLPQEPLRQSALTCRNSWSIAPTSGPRRQGMRRHHELCQELHVFNTASGPILRCRGWSLAATTCTLIKACHDGAVVPGGLRSTNRTGGGSSASGSGGPGTLPRRDDGTQDPPPINDWTAQVQALAANPAWAQEQFAQWQLLHQHLKYQQHLVAASTTDPWQVLHEDGGSTGDRWSVDTGTDRIGV